MGEVREFPAGERQDLVAVSHASGLIGQRSLVTAGVNPSGDEWQPGWLPVCVDHGSHGGAFTDPAVARSVLHEHYHEDDHG
jgi:hypothetical protein